MPKLHPTVQELLDEIEFYCVQAKIDRTTFGLEAMNDGNFITRLELGRNPRFETIDKVRGYIARKTKAVRR